MADEKTPAGTQGGEKQVTPMTPEQEAAIIAKKNAAGEASYAAKTGGGEGSGSAKG